MLHFSCGFHSYIAESCTCVIWVLRSGNIAEIQMWAMAPKKTRISWQEGRTGRRGLFPSEREVGAAQRSRLWSLCWKLPQICGLIQILILLPGPHWVSPTRHHWSDNKTFSCAHLILFDHLMDWGWNEVWWEVDGGGRWQDQMQCWGGKGEGGMKGGKNDFFLAIIKKLTF